MRIAISFVVMSFLIACGGELEIKTQTDSTNENNQTKPGTDLASNCGVDELICRGNCTDIRTNESHCGACGTKCATGSCVDYQCVGASGNNGSGTNNGTTSGNNGTTSGNNGTTSGNNGTTSGNNGTTGETTPNCDFELCNNICTDTTNDPDHCGSCNTTCNGGQVCQNTNCVTLSEVEGVLVASNQARAAGADCGSYGQFPATTPLALDPELNKAAQVHAQDMADKNFFSHTGSDGSNFSTRVGRTNFRGQPIGENIAGGGRDPAGIVARWIDSDGHCRNLMNPQASLLGVGYTVGGQYGTLWVQVFAR